MRPRLFYRSVWTADFVEHAERPEDEPEQENSDARESNRRSTDEQDHDCSDEVSRFPSDPSPELASQAYRKIQVKRERQY
jgi:hypothetical protein